MLTHNFAEILSVVMNKMSENTLETLKADELRSINLMLLGYLRLVKLEFKTPHDSLDESAHAYIHLKGIFKILNSTQDKLLKKIKKDLYELFSTEANKFVQNLTLIHVECLKKPTSIQEESKRYLIQVENHLSNLIRGIKDAMEGPYGSFQEAIRSSLDIGESTKVILKRLAKLNITNTDYYMLFGGMLAHHCNQWVHWADIELNHHQCIAYAVTDDFIFV